MIMTATANLIMALMSMNPKKTDSDPSLIASSKTDECSSLTVGRSGVRLDRFLADHFPDESRSSLQRWIKDGRVTSPMAASLKASSKLKQGQTLLVDLPEEAPPPPPLRAEDISVPLLYQDEDILVVNKPPGLVVHPGPGTPGGTLVNALLALGGPLSNSGGEERPGIVHRLDKDTSGVIVVARNDKAHRHIAAQFKNRETSKTYRAIVRGTPPDSGTIDRPLGRHIKDRKKQAIRYDGGRPSVSHYEVKERFGKFATLVDIRIETGRTHQIRVHMSSIGHGVLADQTYGRIRHPQVDACMPRQALHAARLGLKHPRHEEQVCFEAPLPDDIEKALTALRALAKK
jgi:23S rRNA pseudouridine1911/1915/1917 synthase